MTAEGRSVNEAKLAPEVEAPRGASREGAVFGSDVMADALRALDVPYIALNPGASYRGLHDSIVNYLGNENPRMLLCLHEEHAVAIAHGYAKVTEKPMAAAVHSNVGLMHASMAVFNAWCDRAPVVIMGDLNDNPVDSSVSFILGAQELVAHPQTLALYDLMLKPYKAGQYSLKYKDENDVFDQFIVTGSLLDGISTPQVTTQEGHIFRQDWMLFKHPKYGAIPNRTYSGPIWHGGYSDHLPVYIDVRY